MSRSKHEPLSVVRILNSQDKELYATTSILSKLFRIILADLDIKPKDYYRLVNQWLDDPLYGIKDDIKRKSTIRGNLNKEIVRPDMSMRTFLKALTAATGTESFKLMLKVKRRGQKQETEHVIEIPNLPMIVAQFIHDSPERTQRKKQKMQVNNSESDVTLIDEKEIDDIANDMDSILKASITTKFRNGKQLIVED